MVSALILTFLDVLSVTLHPLFGTAFPRIFIIIIIIIRREAISRSEASRRCDRSPERFILR